MVPSYWSEMDSYHILNFFSLYAAGHLLINPEADPDELLYESALAVTGSAFPENTDILMDALAFIRDARSGDSWNSYWWQEDEYILRKGDYTDIRNRADSVIARFQILIEQSEPEDGIPFPIKRRDLYRLMLPHLLQIRQFALFRCAFRDLESLAEKGADKALLQDRVNCLPFEIPEYNCVVGEFGQPECRIAALMVEEFCAKNALQPPKRDLFRFKFKQRMYESLMTYQRGQSQPIFQGRNSFLWNLAYGERFVDSVIDEMIAENILLCDPATRKIALANWKDFSMDFNI